MTIPDNKDFIYTLSLFSSLEIAKGNVQGHIPINKFGRNTDLDLSVTEDIWDGGGIWVAPTQARKHDIASSDAGDASAGVGMKTMEVYGLLDWDTAEVSEIISMNGVSNVPTVNEYVIIHRMIARTWGSSGPNIGVITATAQTDGTITAQINATQGQTQMAIYGIPSIQTAYITQIYGDVNKSGGAAGGVDIDLCVNPRPDVELAGFLTKHTFGVLTTGTSALPIPFKPPKVFPGPAIIKMDGTAGANNMDVSAHFDLILVTNE